MTKVFISYSHDSDEHREWVLGLSERLRDDGITTILDRYVKKGSPPEGWPNWMLNSLDEATHVLCVCTETYYRRFRGHEIPGKGKGVGWEGNLITNELYNKYNKYNKSNKFIAILRKSGDESYIPEPLQSRTHYVFNTEADYQALYDDLLDQGGVEPGEVGQPKIKPRATGKSLNFTAPFQPFVPQEHSCDKKFLYHLGNLNQVEQRNHFITQVDASCLSNGKAQGFIVAGSKQELPEIIVFTLTHLLKEIFKDEGIDLDTPNIKKLDTGIWKLYEKKPEEFLWKRFNFILENAQAVKSLDDRKNQIKSKLDDEKICQIFYREILSDEAQNHDFLLHTLLAWSKLDLHETAPSHFLLLICETNVLGDGEAVHQWRERLSELLEKHDIQSALLPLQTSPTIKEDLSDWMKLWKIDQAYREQIDERFPNDEEIPLIPLKNKLCEILKDYPFNRKNGHD